MLMMLFWLIIRRAWEKEKSGVSDHNHFVMNGLCHLFVGHTWEVPAILCGTCHATVLVATATGREQQDEN